MKKTMLLGVLMLSAAAGYAQESRQDVSFSGTGIFGPTVHGAANVQQRMTGALGLLMSYRYMLTPRSAIELNYSFAQDSQKYATSFQQNARIHSRQQRLSLFLNFLHGPVESQQDHGLGHHREAGEANARRHNPSKQFFRHPLPPP